MKTLSTAVLCAFGAAFGLAVSATAETETIAYWPFGTNGFHDVSGNGHDFEGVEIAESDAGYVSLNQGTTTNQFLRTAAKLDLSQETAVTFECWCRITERPGGDYAVLFSTPEPWVGTGGFIIYNVGVYQAQMRTSTAGWQLDNSNPVDNWVDGMWHHVAYVIERSRVNDHYSCRLYIDGVLRNNGGTTGGAPFTVPPLFNDFFQIGNCLGYVAGKSYFRGYIDDVRISRGVVAPADFLKYPTVGKTMRADDGKLPVVAYWPFGGKHNRDATGNGFDLTMDSTMPLMSGTPKVAWAERAAFTNFYLTSFPMSAFSKTGVTIECFVKSDSGSASAGNILMLSPTTQYYNNAGAFRFSYEANFKKAGITFRLPTSGKYANSLTTEEGFGALNDNRWRHFAAVYDPSKTGAGIVTFYVDGVAAPCMSDVADQGAFALPDAKLYFSRVAKDSGAFYGQFDDVRITAGVLTPDQFLANRSVGSTVALYRFDKSSADDVSGNGHTLTFEGSSPTFGVGDYAESGTGLVMNGTDQWFHTTDSLDLTHTRAMTVEFDYNGSNPTTDTGINNALYTMAASWDVAPQDGFTIYRSGDGIQGQFRGHLSPWDLYYGFSIGAKLNGYNRCRYVVNTYTNVTTTLCLDGSSDTRSKVDTVTALGNQVMCFGSSPSYGSSYRMKGKYLRIAVSDVALDSADYVLDNLIDPETNKQTLAYWDFNGFDDKAGAGIDLTAEGCSIKKGALALNGASSAATDDTLYLADLTQATIECFVCFGETPSSGTLFSMEAGVGSFAVAVTNNALTGSFIPYDHLAASNGGATPVAPLAGNKAWHHVALVIDRTKPGADAVRFYVDYERATPAGRAWDKAATMLDGTLVVGADSTREGGFFTGYIDDLRVSAGALEPNEFIQASARTEVPDGISIIIR